MGINIDPYLTCSAATEVSWTAYTTWFTYQDCSTCSVVVELSAPSTLVVLVSLGAPVVLVALAVLASLAVQTAEMGV